MTQARYEYIKLFSENNDNLPDGAFFALAEEYDIDLDDWIEFSENTKCN